MWASFYHQRQLEGPLYDTWHQRQEEAGHWKHWVSSGNKEGPRGVPQGNHGPFSEHEPCCVEVVHHHAQLCDLAMKTNQISVILSRGISTLPVSLETSSIVNNTTHSNGFTGTGSVVFKNPSPHVCFFTYVQMFTIVTTTSDLITMLLCCFVKQNKKCHTYKI